MADPSGGIWAWIVANYQGLLVVGAALGLILGYWRSWMASQQATAALKQAEAAAAQVELALMEAKLSKEERSDRQFQVGIELFGNENLSIRLGGIFTLTKMMQRYPDAYHVSVMRLFAAFLADPPRFEGTTDADFGNPDIREIIDIINEMGEEERELERLDHFDLGEHLEKTDFPFISGKIRPKPSPFAITEQPFLRARRWSTSGGESGAARSPGQDRE